MLMVSRRVLVRQVVVCCSVKVAESTTTLLLMCSLWQFSHENSFSHFWHLLESRAQLEGRLLYAIPSPNVFFKTLFPSCCCLFVVTGEGEQIVGGSNRCLLSPLQVSSLRHFAQLLLLFVCCDRGGGANRWRVRRPAASSPASIPPPPLLGGSPPPLPTRALQLQLSDLKIYSCCCCQPIPNQTRGSLAFKPWSVADSCCQWVSRLRDGWRKFGARVT